MNNVSVNQENIQSVPEMEFVPH